MDILTPLLRYPVGGGGHDTTDHLGDIEGFEALLKKLRAALPAGKLLTAAIGSKEEGLKGFTATSVPKYDPYVDWWNVMSYDYTNRRDAKTGFHASNSIMEKVVADLTARNFNTSKLGEPTRPLTHHKGSQPLTYFVQSSVIPCTPSGSNSHPSRRLRAPSTTRSVAPWALTRAPAPSYPVYGRGTRP